MSDQIATERIASLEAELRRAHERITELEGGLQRIADRMDAGLVVRAIAQDILDGAGNAAPKRFKP